MTEFHQCFGPRRSMKSNWRHSTDRKCNACKLKFAESLLRPYKELLYCSYCLPKVKLAHEIIQKLGD